MDGIIDSSRYVICDTNIFLKMMSLLLDISHVVLYLFIPLVDEGV